MISIVIPTLDEAENLGDLLRDLRRGGQAAEIIAADGGSTDRTAAIARAMDARVIHAARGRGRQIAAGAAAARGDILLFLHADCRFPAGGLSRIADRMIERPDAVGGNFRLDFDGGTAFDAWLGRFYAWIRSRGVYYGHSGIFVRRPVYRRLGGIRPIALMEDYDFVRRLERAGPTICIDDPPLLTSSRRFTGRSPVAIFIGWLKIHALFHLGVSPDRLARMYYGK